MTTDVGHTLASDLSNPEHGWWKTFLETIPEGYLNLLAAEEDASRIIHFHPTFIPGLLQTERYASAITPTTTLKLMSAADVATLVQVRMLRQRALLHGDRSKEFTFLLDETALRRPVGSPSIMHEQLNHLLEMAIHPTVNVVVIPLQARPHPGHLGAFMLIECDQGIDDVLCFESPLGNTLVRDQPDLVHRYRVLADQLAQSDPEGIATKQIIVSALAETM
jgi:hypothetical protein